MKMCKYRGKIAGFFISIMLLILLVEFTPHIFNAHPDESSSDNFSVNYHEQHNNAEEGILHTLFDMIVSISEWHGHNAHEHVLILNQIINKVKSILLFVFLLIPIFTLGLLIPVKLVSSYFEDIPHFYRSIHLLTLITRGPPALI